MNFRVTSPKLDISTTTQGPTPTLHVLPVPLGVEVEVVMNVRVMNINLPPAVCISNPTETPTPSFIGAPFASLASGVASSSAICQVRAKTDKLGRVRIVAKDDNTTVQASVIGWSYGPLPSNLLTWDSRLIAPGGRLDSMRHLGGGVVVSGGRSSNMGKMFRSADYGDTWEMVQQLLTSTGISTIAGSGPAAYALAEDSRIWRTLDTGMSWVALPQVSYGTPVGTLTRAYGIAVMPSGTVLVADTQATGHIFRSTDMGATFTDLGAIGDCPLYRMQVIGDGVIVNGWSGKIWKSTDDGLTWSVIPVAGGALYAIEYAGNGVVYMGTDRGQVMRSDDNAQTWKCIGLVSGETDDIAIMDGEVYLSTYTASKEMFLLSDAPVNLGAPPVAGWLDHFIAIDSPCGPMLVGGTSDGYIVRARR